MSTTKDTEKPSKKLEEEVKPEKDKPIEQIF